MSEKLDPEAVEAIMSRIKTEAVKIVESQGGIVNQFVGDEVLALFGIPTAHEDDPRRAVQAALELHGLARNLSGEVEPTIGAPLRMHTGINTGLVVTHLRDDREGRFGITGDTVNVAARLAELAEPDQILLSPDTQRMVAAYYETEICPAAPVKGKSEPLTPYKVSGVSQAQTRFEAAQRRGLTGHVGRERELETLRECFQAATEGKGQAVSVIGEAGLGKSRLVHEFRHGLDLERTNLAIGRCTATGERLSYFPIQDLLRRLSGISDNDTPAEMLEKSEKNALALDPSMEQHLPALLHLLSIPSEKAFPEGMAGEVIRRKVEAALKAYLLAGCREKPLVVIFEDLHWVDDGSEAIMQQYLETIAAYPVLLVMTYRPEYRPPWAHYGHLTPLALKPLGEGGTAQVLAGSLGVEALPEGLAALVHERTEGNPFFTEEVALSLAEEGAVERGNGAAVLARPLTEIAFPDTVQAVVRARIDRLGDGARNVLRLAAVVGREFTENLVARLSENPDPLSERLGELKSLELILEKRFQPEAEFMFKHAITHQVAYDSLLLSRRKALHKLVGLGIEELYAERLPEFHEMLAHHFQQGEVWDKAVDYLVKAGTKAHRNFAIAAALRNFEGARKILERERPELPWETRFGLFFRQGQTLGDIANWSAAADSFGAAVEIAREQEGAGPQRIMATLALAHATLFTQKYGEAAEILSDLEQDAPDSPDIELAILALRGFMGAVVGDLSSLEHFARAKSLLGRAGDSPFVPPAKFIVAMAERFCGDFDESIHHLEEILPILREGASTNRFLAALFMHGLALGEAGRFQEAIDTLQEGRRIGLAAGERYSTPKVTNSLGWVFHELCLVDKAIEYNDLALDAIKELSSPNVSHMLEVESMTRVNLGENFLMKGMLVEARERLESILRVSDNTEFIWNRARWKTRLLIALGELCLAENKID
ncbi:MAG: AAA family ATPase, partial [bacterium]